MTVDLIAKVQGSVGANYFSRAQARREEPSREKDKMESQEPRAEGQTRRLTAWCRQRDRQPPARSYGRYRNRGRHSFVLGGGSRREVQETCCAGALRRQAL